MGLQNQGFWPKINCSQMKFHSVTVCQKLGMILVNKVVQKLKLPINHFYKKCDPKQFFFNEKKNQKDLDDF